MKCKIPAMFLILLVVTIGFDSRLLVAQGQNEWRDIHTVEEVCEVFSDRMITMLGQFKLDSEGLEKVKNAYENREISKACTELLDYYQSGTSAAYLRMQQIPQTQKRSFQGDSIIQNIFTFYRETDKVPNLVDGHLDWSYMGPSDDIEWAWALNRHYPVRDIFEIYLETGNPVYAKYLDSFIKDWIISSLPYPEVKSSTAMWRGLEVSFRVKMWAKVFFGLINTDYLSPATQLLILSSLPEHAHYARNFHAQNNWLTMEISGLATVATAWKELKGTDEWMEYAKKTMVASMKGQVYKDGVQTELTSSYHYVALLNFAQFAQICKNANEELPAYFNHTMESMYSYLAYTMRPDGYGILNNDADRKNNREWISAVMDEYGREDWRYITTNGKEGIKPRGEPSVVYPWAGQLISRSGYNTDAHWSFFDIGPWGSGHQHNDKLHISISAYGRDLLVDAGRFAYRGEVADKFRPYARGSQGHNVILIDGNGQAPGPKVVDTPLTENHYSITPDFDYAWNSFDKFESVEGDLVHSRAMMYVRNNFWIVVDKINTDRPRKIEVLWHWASDMAKPKKMYGAMATANERGNLRILPVGKQNWKIDQVKGLEQPEVQGWYSSEYNKYEPNWTTIFSTQIDQSGTFIWILYPSEGYDLSVNAKLISMDQNSVKLQIKDFEKQEWIATVPFNDSGLAECTTTNRLVK